MRPLPSPIFFGLEIGVILSFVGTYFSVSVIGLGTGLVLIFGILGVLLQRNWRVFSKNPLALPMTILIAALALSILLAAPYAFEKPLGKLRYLLCFFFFAQYFAVKPSARTWVISGGRWIAGILMVTALLQYFGIFSPLPLLGSHPPAPLPHSDGSLFIATGFAFHHSPFACTLVMLFHVFLAHWLLSKESQRHIQYVLPALACSLGILCSFSRGAWLAWVVSTILVITLHNWKRILIAVGSVAGALLLFAIVNPYFRARVLDIKPSANQDRLELWRICFQMFLDAPIFGQGFYSFGTRYQKYTDWHLHYEHFPVEAHNMYMDLLSGTGLVGVGAFFYFLLSWLGLAVREFRARIDASHVPWALASFGMLWAFVTAGIFDKQFYMTQTLVPNLFFLGILASRSLGEKLEAR